MASRICALYEIWNTVNGKRYVGSSVNVRRRWQNHVCDLRAGRHGNPHLQAAWNQYGESAFVFLVLAVLEPSELQPTETRLLGRVVGRADCYNLCSSAEAPGRGQKRTPEHRARISAILRQRSRSCYASVRRALTGRSVSAETRERIRAARMGRKHSPATREKIGRSKRGTTLSSEHREKIGQALRGRKRDPAAVERTRLGLLGQRKGVPLTPDHRARISEGLRRWHAQAEEERQTILRTRRIRSPVNHDQDGG